MTGLRLPKQKHKNGSSGFVAVALLSAAAVALVAGVAAWELGRIKDADKLAENATKNTSFSSGAQKPLVLGETASGFKRFFEVNIPAVFRDKVETKDVTIGGALTLQGNVSGEDVNIDIGEGKITAGNVVYSLQQKTGDLQLEAGKGISIDGLKISATDNLVTQKLFKKYKTDSGTVEAKSESDTLTIVGGDGVKVSASPNSRTITVSAEEISLGENTTGDYVKNLTSGTGIEISETSGEGTSPEISLNHLGLQSLTSPSADRIYFYDGASGTSAWLSVGSGLNISGNTLSASASGYSASGTLLQLVGTTFSLKEGTLTDGKICVYSATNGLVCNTDPGVGGVSYTAGNDLDLTGTEFALESTIDTVSTINFAGTGTINALDAIDATTETTLEGALDVAGDVSGTGLSNLQLGAGVVDANELASTAVTPGSYTNANITVDADGRITAAANGATPNSQEVFKTYSVSGQSDVVADSTADILTLAAGSNVSITTDASSDTITINATDTNTTYSAGGTLLQLIGTTFSLKEGTLTNGKICTYDTTSGIVCNTTVVSSLTGTANQITVSSSTGDVTLSLPQNIATSSTPTFGGMVLNGGLQIYNGTYKTTIANSGSQTTNISYVLPTAAGSAGEALKTDAYGNLYWATIEGGSGGIGTVTSVGSGNGISGGPITTSGTLDIDLLSSEVASTATTSSYSGLEFIGASGQLGLIHGCANNEVLSWNNTDKKWQCASISGIGGIDGSGATNYVAYWSDSNTLAGEANLDVTRGGTGVGTLTGLVLGNGTSDMSAVTTSSGVADAISDETGTGILVFATSPTITTPTIAKLANLTSNGFVKTSNSDGTLSVDTNTYLTGNQTITLTGDVTGSGTTSIATTIGNDKVLESMLKAVDTASDEDILTFESTTGDFEWHSSTELKTSMSLNNVENTALSTWTGSANITTLGTITSGTWSGSIIAPSKGGTGVANNDASTLTISGNYGTTLTVSGTTALTRPTSGTVTALGNTTTGSGSIVLATSPTITTPTITTSATVPLIIGGTSTTSDLTLQTTSGVGTTGADMHFLVGNNGGTEAMTILNSGYVGIGNSSPGSLLTVSSLVAPVTDIVSISNSGYGTVTNGVDGLFIDFTAAADTASDTNTGLNISYTPSAESGDTGRGINVSAIGISAGTLYGINIAGITAGAGTEKALVIGSGWDTSIDAAGTIIGGAFSVVGGSYHTIIQGGSQSADLTLTLPITAGSSGQALTTNGSGTLSWSSVPSGSGALNRVAYWSDASTLTSNAGFTFDGTTLTAPTFNASTVASGFQANSMRLITNQGSSGSENLFLGQSGNFTTTGTNNIFAGYQAGLADVAGVDNISIGYQTLYSNTYGAKNVAIGSGALYTQSYANGNSAWDTLNTAIGYHSLYSNQPTSTTNGYLNTALGSYSLQANTIGARNVAIGSGNTTAATQAPLYSNVEASDNIAIGNAALRANTYAEKNIAIGTGALYTQSYSSSSTPWDSSNIAIGYNAMYAHQPTSAGNGVNNIAIGSYALDASTTGALNIAIGKYSLTSNTGGYQNIAMGQMSLGDNVSGNYNIAIGYEAGRRSKVSDNVFIGTESGNANTYGAKNVALGSQALYTQSYANGNSAWDTANVAIGYQALYSNQPTSSSNGYHNTALGYQAGYTNATGASNVFLGYKAGYYETSSNKLFIDNQQRASEADARTKALVYGIFDASTANQSLTVNGSLRATGDSAPTSDIMAVSNSGYGTTTTGVDGLSIDFTQTTDSGADTNTALNVSTTASGESGDTLNGLNISTAGISAGTLNGINIGGITAGSGTEYALVIGSGWDRGLSVDSVSTFNEAITLAGNARPTRQITLSPEFPGATMSGDGGSNTGTMTSDFCAASAGVGGLPATNTSVCNTSGDLHNYYSWTTSEATAQDYDIWIRWRVPDNFSAWASNPIDVYGKRTDTTNNAVTVYVYDTAGTLENSGGTQVAGTAWTSTTVEASFAGTYTPGAYMTIQIHVVADTGGDSAQVGEINLDYLAGN